MIKQMEIEFETSHRPVTTKGMHLHVPHIPAEAHVHTHTNICTLEGGTRKKKASLRETLAMVE